MIKVKVFLGYPLYYKMDDWNEMWIKDEANDPYPYGYNWAQSSDVAIKYIQASSLEKKIKSDLLKKILLLIVLPFKFKNSDVVWTHWDRDALILAFFKKVPLLKNLLPNQVSCFVWLIDEYKNFSKMKLWFIKWLLKEVDQIILHAETEKTLFINYFNIEKNKVNHVPFGINIDAYSKGKLTPINNVKTPFILSVGNDRHRDISMLIRIANYYPELNFILASSNASYIDRVRDIKNITTLSVNFNQMKWLYKNCLFVVVPLSYNEHVSGCTTVLESGANSKVIITNNTPGMDYYVKNMETGMLVELNNFDGFKKCIDKLLNNRILLNKLENNAFKYVKHFSTKKWAEEHVNITIKSKSNE